MHNEKIAYLLKKYLDNSITSIEWRQLMELLSDDRGSGAVRSVLEELIRESPAIVDYQESEWESFYQETILAMKGPIGAPADGDRQKPPVPLRWKRWMVAAAVLILFAGAGGALLYRGNGPGQPARPVVRRQAAPGDDVAPGGNKAVLTLADGSTIDLDEAKNGLLVRQGGSRLVKQNGGQLAYTGDSRAGTAIKGMATKEIQYNLLTTPRGGQYQLILPDGSKVWLNAASSLKYPATFTGKERTVELQGEAYFEVAKNADMPFRVSVDNGKGEGPMQVEVLGTQFNVKAYADEPAINTTLLEGAVRVHRNGQAATIRPGEQAKLNGAGMLKVETADTEEAVAWKNGLFRFDEATIEDVMRQLSRWYDVEVVYVNEAPKDLFRGEIYRNVNVSKVLKVLEASGVRFTVEGKKILVQS
jgi:transmembrane sensor